MSPNEFEVTSSDEKTLYKVHVKEIISTYPCTPSCSKSECQYLCRHKVECTCPDYKRGHLCKHSHAVIMKKKGIRFIVLLMRLFLIYHHERNQRLQVRIYTFTDLTVKKKEIKQYLEQMLLTIEDSNILDRVQALLIKASAAMQSVSGDKDIKPFVGSDKFAPAKKNEVQLRFKQTTHTAGRKKKDSILKYIHKHQAN